MRVFGFHPLAILVPQALMGVATVALTYDLVRRRFGRRAGFVAGLVLAPTPITVAISRHNTPDALLVLCCTGGRAGGPDGGGGAFGGDTPALSEALAYTPALGGGTIAVASQSGAGTQVIDGAEVAAIGGFSGNESEVSVRWLADAVASGKVRWVLTSGGASFADGCPAAAP